MPIVEWFDFRNPDYDRVFELRANRLKAMRDKPQNILAIKAHYKENPVDFINDWGMTFDPRNAERGLPTTIPFLLFDKQAEFVEWVIERWRGQESCLAEKSRDMGVSWLCVAVAVWMWLYHPGTVVGFGSRKEEYVDKIGDPKSLFEKIRQFIKLLPKELRPIGYNEKKCAFHMRVLNPENGASIVGEAGDNIGRGARASVYFKDESAFYERPDAVDAALSQTSNCNIDVSTPNGAGNPFYRKRHSGKIPVFTFHWTDDPRKDEEWYRKQCDELDAVIVAQEIDIDYNASVEDAWISGDIVLKAMRNAPANVEAIGQWQIGVDAAHMGNDESVIHMRKGRLNLEQVTRGKVDGVQLAGLVEEQCRKLESAGGIIGRIVIEMDGPGVSCVDQLRQGKYAAKVCGVHTGARLRDDRNYNIRAKMWRSARDYLEDEPIVLPFCPELRSQLSSVKYRYKDGLLLMQDKKEYKKSFNKSPDRADAFVLTFAEGQSGVSYSDIYG